MRSQAGVFICARGLEPICARGTLAMTTLRSVMSTRVAVAVTNSELSGASLPFGGASPSTRPPVAGSVRITSHGTDAVTDTGVSEISGAVTLVS